jgi:hypothetical protein
MITKTELTELELQDIEEYNDYIIESYINGQFDQAKQLYRDLSVPQQRDFGDYLVLYEICDDWDMNMTELQFIYFLEG